MMTKTTKIYTVGSMCKGKYGDFTILAYENKSKILIEFTDTKHTKYTDAKSIRKGTVKDPYFKNIFGVGSVGLTDTSYNGKVKVSYHTWRGMLRRCYDSKSYTKHPTYKDCTVCYDWLCFEVFEKWYEDNKRIGYEIDKDLTIVGNKVYSPETCCFVPPYINALISTTSSGNKDLPTGVSYHSRDNIYNAKCWDGGDGRLVHLGDYHCPDEAHVAYVDYKTKYTQKVAEKAYKIGDINTAVYNNLIQWSFT